MSAWDHIMPHRLLINKSLRKVSQELRDRVETYQIEFNRRLEECQSDLQRAEEKKNRELEAFKEDLLRELGHDQQTLGEIQGNILKYIDRFFYRAYLYQLLEIDKRRNDILHEDYVFLSSQIKTIDDEVVLLRERQNELTVFTGVDDIIHLASLTGYDLDFQPTDDAKQLLGKISDALEAYSGEDRVEKYALLRLKTIIQERSDYLPTINYISWVIRIKNRYRKQLSSKRSDVKKEQAILRENMTSVRNEIRIVTEELELLAERIRYYWAKPITYLNADICYTYVELKGKKEKLRNEAPALRRERKELNDKRRSAISEIRDKKRERREVGSELRSMSESHSSDQWKWDSLQRRGSSLTSEISSLSSDIDRYSSDVDSLTSKLDSLESAVQSTEVTISSKKEARKKWEEKRTRIVVLIKRYDKSFRIGPRIAQKDEIRIIVTRLGEIQDIRAKGVAEAQEVYEKESDEITRLHEEKVGKLEAQRKDLQTRLQNTELEYTECLARVSLAKKNLESAKNADARLGIIKRFSEAPAVTAAREELKKAQGEFVKKQETIAIIQSKIRALEDESEKETKDFNENTNNCKPRYLRPDEKEQQEEKKLSLRLDEINHQQKEDGYES